MFGSVDVVVDGAALTARLRDIEARQRLLDAERAAVLHAWDRGQAWADDGSATAAARLARETAISGSAARERVRVAGLLASSMPHTEAAAAELGWPKVRLLANAVNPRTAAAFAAHEELLVDQARELTVDQLALLLGHWRRLVDEDGANADADAMHDRAYLRLDVSWAGEGFLHGRLAPEDAAIVKSVLDQLADELYRAERREHAEAVLRGDDPPQARSASNRYADALVEMARRAAATTAAEAAGATVTPARPLVLVNLDADDRGAVLARLAGGAPLPTTDAVRLACDAAVARVVTRDGIVPLELGRTTRDPSEAQRRAMAVIWATCAFAGCDRPFAWCDLHHVWWWEHGGPTDIDWLLPLCKRHHTSCHKGVFVIQRRPDGTFAFTRPDGTPIGDANPTISQLYRTLRHLTTTSTTAA